MDSELYLFFALRLGFLTPAQAVQALADYRASGRPLRDALRESGWLSTLQDESVTRAMAAPSRAMDAHASETIPVADAEPPSGSLSPPPSETGTTGQLMQVSAEPVDVPLTAPGHYERLQLLGAGGHAQVTAVRDNVIGRRVAMKELSALGATEQQDSQSINPQLHRFWREASITAQLEHPSIVPVYDVGQHPDGSLYYTMRWVRGRTLREALLSCADLDQRLTLLNHFLDLCNALAYAHSRGVLHRDLKPSNVMVGEFGETVLLDWGIAKVKGHEDEREALIDREVKLLPLLNAGQTAPGAALGTPSYMSPEQAQGLVSEIDERSDIWGLGAVLYELLVGAPPFTGNSAAEVVENVCKAPVPKVLAACPLAPPELAAIVDKAMQRRKADRYQSAKALAADISAYLTGKRVVAFEYSALQLLRRFYRRHRMAFAAAAVILAAIVVSLVVTTVAYEKERVARAREAEAHARAREEHLTGSFYLAQAYVKEADRLLAAKRFLAARLYSAASLLANPAASGSAVFEPTFAARRPDSDLLRIDAVSQLYRADRRLILGLARELSLGEPVSRVAHSRDGTHLAALNFSGGLSVWELGSGARIFRVQAKTEEMRSLSVSADGMRLVTAGGDPTVAVWEVGKPAPIVTFDKRVTGGGLATISSDGRFVATDSPEAAPLLWDVATGALVKRLPAHRDIITDMHFGPDGTTLLTASRDHTARIYDLKGSRPPLDLAGHEDRVYSVRSSADGQLIATASWDKTVRLWSAKDGKLLRILKGHRDGIVESEFSPSGHYLVSVGFERSLRFWDTQSGQLLDAIDGEDCATGSAGFGTGDATLETVTFDGTLHIWGVARDERRHRLVNSGWIFGVAWSPDGRTLATGGAAKTVSLWDVATGDLKAALDGHQNYIRDVRYSPDGSRLASGDNSGLLIIWDAATHKPLAKADDREGGVYALAFSPDGGRLATTGRDGTLRLYDGRSGAAIVSMPASDGPCSGVAFSPDGGLLVTACNDRSVKVWDTRRFEVVRALTGHSDWASGLAFSPDGKLLVTSGKDRQVIVWEVATWRELARQEAHKDWVNYVFISGSGKRLVSTSDDNSVLVWQLSPLRPLLRISASALVNNVAFSPDERLLAVPDFDTVNIVPLDFALAAKPPAEVLAEAEKLANQRLEGFELQRRTSTPRASQGAP